jgi:hypothetical protein
LLLLRDSGDSSRCGLLDEDRASVATSRSNHPQNWMEVEVNLFGERADTRPAEETNNYCNSLVTACCVLLACARALMPVWVRIWNFDSCDVAVV